MNVYTNLAKQSIAYYFKNKKAMSTPDDSLADLLNHRAGTFVSLHKKDGALRGCIGTLMPTKKNIAQEIIYNALSAAFADNRFDSLQEDELDDLVISVDVLSKPEAINSIKELNPKKYGVIVQTNDGRSGVLLPNLEGIDSIEQQISIACQKAGIDPNKDKILLFRFMVERHE
ncbi:MAG: AmmeMemoRadiSam system protein A [Candidatus Parcubacteria bacterium]|nr:AmmeMemoRadiSam system protein A [Candidatus Parcubacteria bacterium]